MNGHSVDDGIKQPISLEALDEPGRETLCRLIRNLGVLHLRKLVHETSLNV